MSRKKGCLDRISRKIECQKKHIKKKGSKENLFQLKHPGNSVSVVISA